MEPLKQTTTIVILKINQQTKPKKTPIMATKKLGTRGS